MSGLLYANQLLYSYVHYAEKCLSDLQMNLKLLNCNKNNYIDNDSLVKMKEDYYTVLHNNEIYKKYLNEDMSIITQYLQKYENIFRKAVKLLK